MRFWFTLISKLTFLLLICMAILSCKEKQHKLETRKDLQELKEPLIKANQFLLRNEDARIEAFINRHQWVMQKTKTGLRYWIYQHNNGVIALDGKTVALEYTVHLLNGESLYSSKTEGPMILVLGKDKIITGLEEGIFLMQEGDKAKFIIPSHLGFGLAGDDKKVPKKATLVYDLSLISVK